MLGAIPGTVYLVKQQQEIRSRAQSTDSACTLPGAVTNVQIEYPNCQGNDCFFEEANCSWDAVTGAVTYNLKIAELDTGSVVKEETLNSGTTKVVFSVTQGKTYKCDITAVNSCGQTGGTGSDTRLCKVEGIVATSTPTPTVPLETSPTPTSPPEATATPVPTEVPEITETPTPTLPPSGGINTSVIFSGGLATIILGGIFFALLGL